jgi:lysophospholipase L1-like esterase
MDIILRARTAKAVAFALTTAVLVLIVCVAGAEILARASGRRPRRVVPRPEPIMHAPDAVLGWRPIPGKYQLGPYAPGSPPVPVTIRPDGARATGKPPSPEHRAVVLVGCSFTMGWAVADEETWGGRLQAQRPDLDVVNRGVAGYGTLQALLLLEELLRNGQRPAWVLYGDIGHDLRNVGSLTWLAMLAATRSTVATPYCTMETGGAVTRHPPQSYPSLPLHAQLASVALVESMWARWQTRDRRGTNGQVVTDQLIVDIAELCRRHGVGFSNVILTLTERVRAARVAFAARHHIDLIDCNLDLSPSLTVPSEGHPNAVAHQRWGDCVATALTQRLPTH